MSEKTCLKKKRVSARRMCCLMIVLPAGAMLQALCFQMELRQGTCLKCLVSHELRTIYQPSCYGQTRIVSFANGFQQVVSTTTVCRGLEGES